MNEGGLDKEMQGLDPETVLRQFLNRFGGGILSNIGQYNDFPGVVEDNDDPEKLGRVKVRVHAVYGTIPTKDLPWAIPEFSDGASKTGSFVVPKVNSLVRVKFAGDDVYAPRYSSRVWFKSRLPEERLEDYPDSAVLYYDDEGNSVVFNRKTYLMTVRSASGVVLKINKAGNVALDTTATDGQIKITTRTKVILEAAEVEIVNDTGSKVTPNPGMGGPFCAIPNCLFTGTPHQGKKVGNCLVKSSDI